MPTQVKKKQIDTSIIDGWTPVDATWTYASASTITVPSGAASIYQKGDRIKWTQTTVKYGVIVAVADTLLTIAVNTDYTVANAAITLNYYSHQANPLGYPNQFSYSPTQTWTNAPTSQTVNAKYEIIGCRVFGRVSISGTANGSNSGTDVAHTLPVTPETIAGSYVGNVMGMGIWSQTGVFTEMASSYIIFSSGTLYASFPTATRKPDRFAVHFNYAF